MLRYKLKKDAEITVLQKKVLKYKKIKKNISKLRNYSFFVTLKQFIILSNIYNITLYVLYIHKAKR